METDKTVDGKAQAKPATIYEVARHLRGNGGLKAATVSKVQQAIDEINYSAPPKPSSGTQGKS